MELEPKSLMSALVISATITAQFDMTVLIMRWVYSLLCFKYERYFHETQHRRGRFFILTEIELVWFWPIFPKRSFYKSECDVDSKARTKHLSHDFNLQCSLISWFVFPWNGIRSESTHSECNEFVNYSDKSVLIYLFRDQSSLKYRKIVAWSNLSILVPHRPKPMLEHHNIIIGTENGFIGLRHVTW